MGGGASSLPLGLLPAPGGVSRAKAPTAIAARVRRASSVGGDSASPRWVTLHSPYPGGPRRSASRDLSRSARKAQIETPAQRGPSRQSAGCDARWADDFERSPWGGGRYRHHRSASARAPGSLTCPEVPPTRAARDAEVGACQREWDSQLRHGTRRVGSARHSRRRLPALSAFAVAVAIIEGREVVRARAREQSLTVRPRAVRRWTPWEQGLRGRRRPGGPRRSRRLPGDRKRRSSG